MRLRRGDGTIPGGAIPALVRAARTVWSLAVASYLDLGDELSAALAWIGGEAVPDLGPPDAPPPGRLTRFASDPMKDREFLEVLFLFRHERAFRKVP